MLIMMIQCDRCEATTRDWWIHPIDSAEAMAQGMESQALGQGWIRTDIDCPIKGAGWMCAKCLAKTIPAAPGDKDNEANPAPDPR